MHLRPGDPAEAGRRGDGGLSGSTMVATAGSAFHGLDLVALAISASPPFLAAAWWVVRRLRRNEVPDV